MEGAAAGPCGLKTLVTFLLRDSPDRLSSLVEIKSKRSFVDSVPERVPILAHMGLELGRDLGVAVRRRVLRVALERDEMFRGLREIRNKLDSKSEIVSV